MTVSFQVMLATGIGLQIALQLRSLGQFQFLRLLGVVSTAFVALSSGLVRADLTLQDQPLSITQFSDVQPTDWAYQALSNLIERYGCVAGYPNGSFRRNRAMTRYEAAALLNACLDRITEVTDELKRLMKEFERELAVLRGRVDGLEARVGELEATLFSTTTKLRGFATFVLGGNRFAGSNTASSDADLRYTTAYNQAHFGAALLNYDVRLDFDTSFSGRDLLRTTLRADNFFGAHPSPYGTGLTFLAVATNGPPVDNQLRVNRLFYHFPLGDRLSLTVGPRVRIDDPGMLGMWPSVYTTEPILDFFAFAGATGAYNTSYGLGTGVGGSYRGLFGIQGLSLSANYVSQNASDGDSGVMTQGSSSTSVTQLGYVGQRFPGLGGSAWGIGAAYTYSENMALRIATPYAIALSSATTNGNSSSNVGLSGYWVPEDSPWIPSLSVGWGLSRYSETFYWTNQSPETQSWSVGLQWTDVWVKGNSLGMAFGQAPFVTVTGGGGAFSAEPVGVSGFPLDSNMVWECWYRIQISDSVTLTPAMFWISNVDGQYGKYDGGSTVLRAGSSVLGGLVKTTFQF